MLELIIDIVKLILAVVLGFIIGTERQQSGKPVGRRTMALVCIGSTLATMIALNYFPSETGRVLAGIVTGIGFLGAGAIVAKGGTVKGLTTAAAIWAIAIVGIAVGMGDYFLALIVTILMYLILVLPWDKKKENKKV